MVLSKAQKQDAYREAQQILRLSEKWQELMPGERKPNFARAAQEILRRALGHQTKRNEAPLDLHGGLMHEHKPREARLIERYLRSGTVHPDVLHSFQHNRTTNDPDPLPVSYDLGHDPDLPDFDLYVQDTTEDHDYPSHYEVGAKRFHSSMHVEPPFQELKSQVPAGATMSNHYEAVH
jgi:hypothetical protein